MNSTDTKSTAPRQWVSLEDWRNDSEYRELVEQEFQSSPFAPEDSEGGWARREFLKLMGASMALTSFGCVRRPAQKIIPYVNRPTEVVNGIANYYTSTLVSEGEAYGLVIKTREGRPIKIEGNPDHPSNMGALPARAHATLLSLYDPDRLTTPKRNVLNKEKSNADVISTTYEDIDAVVKAAVKSRKLAFLTGTVLSPTTRQMLSDFRNYSGAKVYNFDNLDQSAVRNSQRASYGKAVVPRYKIDKADYILALGSDFLGTGHANVEYSKQFARRRKPENINKLVSFESMLSMTGMNADERHQVKPSELSAVVVAIINYLVLEKRRSAYAADSAVKSLVSKFESALTNLSVGKEAIEAVAEELWTHRGKSLVVAGTNTSSDPVGLNIAANFLNSLLGNDGKTVDATGVTSNSLQGSYSDVVALNNEVQAGRVNTVVIWGTNPAYSLPANSEFHALVKKAENVIYVGDRIDETGKMSNYVAAESHSFEKWTDSEGQDGVYSIGQPTITPLYSTRSFEQNLLAWGSDSSRFSGMSEYDYLKKHWQNNIWASNRGVGIGSKSFEDFWEEVLQVGVFNTSSRDRDRNQSSRNFSKSALSKVMVPKASEIELVLYPTVALGDGSLANVPWLQELPDPVTKIVWDNYISLSVHDAHKMHIKQGQVVELTASGSKLKLPVHIQPGQKSGVAAIALGFGRTAAGKVANGVGQNAYALASLSKDVVVYSGQAVSLMKTNETIPLANPQGHQTMRDERFESVNRPIAIETTVDNFKKNPESGIHRHKMMTMWSGHEYKGHKWGMTIDLNACNGCSACVVACQSENNVPVVGKKYVMEGRIMQWIRVDRYYVGQPEDPAVLNIPITCQHCDNAPCETVCPVAATTHSDEGLNDMIYNRCVGTRYCANNCPYKVRRFNWFNYIKEVKNPQQMALNPDVTVRKRGVMEKCSFCSPRIKVAKEKATQENRNIQDGDVVTACQQSCPTDAIQFGDLNDPTSKVAQVYKQKNSYALLEELNAQPAIRYQTKIRNTAELKGGHDGHQGGH